MFCARADTPSIFVQRGIADQSTLEMASLSAEPDEHSSFVVTVFEVEDDGSGMDAFREREEEFELRMVPYTTLEGAPAGIGMLCVASSDAAYAKQWGQARFEELYTTRGLRTIWDWPRDSGLRPCAAYLRHCALAAERLGAVANASFLDQTFLCDRTTSLRSYLELNPHVMTTLPPESLRERYSG